MSEIEKIIEDFYNNYRQKMNELDYDSNLGLYSFTKGIFSYNFVLSNELMTILEKYKDKDDYKTLISLLKYISIVATVFSNVLPLEDFKVLRTYLKHNCRIVLEEDKIKKLISYLISKIDVELYDMKHVNKTNKIRLTKKAIGLLHFLIKDMNQNEPKSNTDKVMSIILYELTNLYYKDEFDYKMLRNLLDINILKIWIKCSINKG